MQANGKNVRTRVCVLSIVTACYDGFMRFKRALVTCFLKCCAVLLPAALVLCTPLRAYATEDERKALPVQSNETPDWPQGPATGAKGAILMETSTGTVLYAKNIHERLYPASTTKLMTCLVAMEHASLSDTVTVSANAINAVPSDGVRLGIAAGRSLTMEQALYAIMVRSANDISNAVAEHVAGSVPAFADLMNERAASLGLTGTHFVNANGLHDENHYTTPYDLCVIAEAFFDSVSLSEIGGTPRYHIEPSPTQPDEFYLTNKHALITGTVSVEGVIGGKTGFTDEAGECLVTCAERNGMRLISVVMFEDSPSQFNDSASLLEYGFANFSPVLAQGNENLVFPETPAFFLADRNLFSRDITSFSFAYGSHLILPAGKTFADAHMTVSSTGAPEAQTAMTLGFDFNAVPVGTVDVIRATVAPATSSLARAGSRIIYIDLRLVLAGTVGVIAAVTALVMMGQGGYFLFFGKEAKQRRRRRRKRRRR